MSSGMSVAWQDSWKWARQVALINIYNITKTC